MWNFWNFISANFAKDTYYRDRSNVINDISTLTQLRSSGPPNCNVSQSNVLFISVSSYKKTYAIVLDTNKVQHSALTITSYLDAAQTISNSYTILITENLEITGYQCISTNAINLMSFDLESSSIVSTQDGCLTYDAQNQILTPSSELNNPKFVFFMITADYSIYQIDNFVGNLNIASNTSLVGAFVFNNETKQIQSCIIANNGLQIYYPTVSDFTNMILVDQAQIIILSEYGYKSIARPQDSILNRMLSISELITGVMPLYRYSLTNYNFNLVKNPKSIANSAMPVSCTAGENSKNIIAVQFGANGAPLGYNYQFGQTYAASEGLSFASPIVQSSDKEITYTTITKTLTISPRLATDEYTWRIFTKQNCYYKLILDKPPVIIVNLAAIFIHDASGNVVSSLRNADFQIYASDPEVSKSYIVSGGKGYLIANDQLFANYYYSTTWNSYFPAESINKLIFYNQANNQITFGSSVQDGIYVAILFMQNGVINALENIKSFTPPVGLIGLYLMVVSEGCYRIADAFYPTNLNVKTKLNQPPFPFYAGVIDPSNLSYLYDQYQVIYPFNYSVFCIRKSASDYDCGITSNPLCGALTITVGNTSYLVYYTKEANLWANKSIDFTMYAIGNPATKTTTIQFDGNAKAIGFSMQETSYTYLDYIKSASSTQDMNFTPGTSLTVNPLSNGSLVLYDKNGSKAIFNNVVSGRNYLLDAKFAGLSGKLQLILFYQYYNQTWSFSSFIKTQGITIYASSNSNDILFIVGLYGVSPFTIIDKPYSQNFISNVSANKFGLFAYPMPYFNVSTPQASYQSDTIAPACSIANVLLSTDPQSLQNAKVTIQECVSTGSTNSFELQFDSKSIPQGFTEQKAASSKTITSTYISYVPGTSLTIAGLGANRINCSLLVYSGSSFSRYMCTNLQSESYNFLTDLQNGGIATDVQTAILIKSGRIIDLIALDGITVYALPLASPSQSLAQFIYFSGQLKFIDTYGNANLLSLNNNQFSSIEQLVGVNQTRTNVILVNSGIVGQTIQAIFSTGSVSFTFDSTGILQGLVPMPNFINTPTNGNYIQYSPGTNLTVVGLGADRSNAALVVYCADGSRTIFRNLQSESYNFMTQLGNAWVQCAILTVKYNNSVAIADYVKMPNIRIYALNRKTCTQNLDFISQSVVRITNLFYPGSSAMDLISPTAINPDNYILNTSNSSITFITSASLQVIIPLNPDGTMQNSFELCSYIVKQINQKHINYIPGVSLTVTGLGSNRQNAILTVYTNDMKRFVYSNLQTETTNLIPDKSKCIQLITLAIIYPSYTLLVDIASISTISAYLLPRFNNPGLEQSAQIYIQGVFQDGYKVLDRIDGQTFATGSTSPGVFVVYSNSTTLITGNTVNATLEFQKDTTNFTLNFNSQGIPGGFILMPDFINTTVNSNYINMVPGSSLTVQSIPAGVTAASLVLTMYGYGQDAVKISFSSVTVGQNLWPNVIFNVQAIFLYCNGVLAGTNIISFLDQIKISQVALYMYNQATISAFIPTVYITGLFTPTTGIIDRFDAANPLPLAGSSTSKYFQKSIPILAGSSTVNPTSFAQPDASQVVSNNQFNLIVVGNIYAEQATIGFQGPTGNLYAQITQNGTLNAWLKQTQTTINYNPGTIQKVGIYISLSGGILTINDFGGSEILIAVAIYSLPNTKTLLYLYTTPGSPLVYNVGANVGPNPQLVALYYQINDSKWSFIEYIAADGISVYVFDDWMIIKNIWPTQGSSFGLIDPIDPNTSAFINLSKNSSNFQLSYASFSEYDSGWTNSNYNQISILNTNLLPNSSLQINSSSGWYVNFSFDENGAPTATYNGQPYQRKSIRPFINSNMSSAYINFVPNASLTLVNLGANRANAVVVIYGIGMVKMVIANPPSGNLLSIYTLNLPSATNSLPYFNAPYSPIRNQIQLILLYFYQNGVYNLVDFIKTEDFSIHLSSRFPNTKSEKFFSNKVCIVGPLSSNGSKCIMLDNIASNSGIISILPSSLNLLTQAQFVGNFANIGAANNLSSLSNRSVTLSYNDNTSQYIQFGLNGLPTNYGIIAYIGGRCISGSATGLTAMTSKYISLGSSSLNIVNASTIWNNLMLIAYGSDLSKSIFQLSQFSQSENFLSDIKNLFSGQLQLVLLYYVPTSGMPVLVDMIALPGITVYNIPQQQSNFTLVIGLFNQPNMALVESYPYANSSPNITSTASGIHSDVLQTNLPAGNNTLFASVPNLTNSLAFSAGGSASSIQFNTGGIPVNSFGKSSTNTLLSLASTVINYTGVPSFRRTLSYAGKYIQYTPGTSLSITGPSSASSILINATLICWGDSGYKYSFSNPTRSTNLLPQIQAYFSGNLQMAVLYVNMGNDQFILDAFGPSGASTFTTIGGPIALGYSTNLYGSTTMGLIESIISNNISGCTTSGCSIAYNLNNSFILMNSILVPNNSSLPAQISITRTSGAPFNLATSTNYVQNCRGITFGNNAVVLNSASSQITSSNSNCSTYSGTYINYTRSSLTIKSIPANSILVCYGSDTSRAIFNLSGYNTTYNFMTDINTYFSGNLRLILVYQLAKTGNQVTISANAILDCVATAESISIYNILGGQPLLYISLPNVSFFESYNINGLNDLTGSPQYSNVMPTIYGSSSSALATFAANNNLALATSAQANAGLSLRINGISTVVQANLNNSGYYSTIAPGSQAYLVNGIVAQETNNIATNYVSPYISYNVGTSTLQLVQPLSSYRLFCYTTDYNKFVFDLSASSTYSGANHNFISDIRASGSSSNLAFVVLYNVSSNTIVDGVAAPNLSMKLANSILYLKYTNTTIFDNIGPNAISSASSNALQCNLPTFANIGLAAGANTLLWTNTSSFTVNYSNGSTFTVANNASNFSIIATIPFGSVPSSNYINSQYIGKHIRYVPGSSLQFTGLDVSFGYGLSGVTYSVTCYSSDGYRYVINSPTGQNYLPQIQTVCNGNLQFIIVTANNPAIANVSVQTYTWVDYCAASNVVNFTAFNFMYGWAFIQGLWGVPYIIDDVSGGSATMTGVSTNNNQANGFWSLRLNSAINPTIFLNNVLSSALTINVAISGGATTPFTLQFNRYNFPYFFSAVNNFNGFGTLVPCRTPPCAVNAGPINYVPGVSLIVTGNGSSNGQTGNQINCYTIEGTLINQFPSSYTSGTDLMPYITQVSSGYLSCIVVYYMDSNSNSSISAAYPSLNWSSTNPTPTFGSWGVTFIPYIFTNMLLGNQNSAHNLPTNFINGGTFSSYPYFSAFCNIGLGQSPSVQNNSVACFSINNIPAFNANFPFVYGWDGGFVILPDFTALTANGGANYANADVDGITAGNGQSIVFEVWTGGSAGTFYNIWNSNSWNNKPPMLPNS